MKCELVWPGVKVLGEYNIVIKQSKSRQKFRGELVPSQSLQRHRVELVALILAIAGATMMYKLNSLIFVVSANKADKSKMKMPLTQTNREDGLAEGKRINTRSASAKFPC